MREPNARANRKLRRWIHLPAIALLVIGIAAAAVVVHSRNTMNSAAWEEIQKLSRGRKWTELESKLARWVRANPEHTESRLMLANLRLGLDRHDEAVQLLRAVPESSPSWTGAQMMLGELAIRERRAREAESIFRHVAHVDARSIEPRQRLFYLLSLQQRTAEAREVLWQMYEIRDDPKILVDLVLELLQDQQDVRGLPPELEQFVKVSDDDPFLRRAWGMSLLYQGRTVEALENLEAAADMLVNDPVGRFALAECRILNGMPVIVDQILGPVPEAPDDAEEWWLCRGRIEVSNGLDEAALSSFERAIALQPKWREAHFRLGQLLTRLGRKESARNHLAVADRIAQQFKTVRREHQQVRAAGLPADARLFERLGRLCFSVGFISEARAWWDQALKLDPTLAEVQTKLAELETVQTSMPVFLADPRLASRPDSGRYGTAKTSGSVATANQPHEIERSITASLPFPFEDQARKAGVTYNYDSGASDQLFLADTMGGGVGLIDFDNDGWLDIYFVNGFAIPFDISRAPHPNVLYRNQGDGTFRDVTEKAGVAGIGYGMGCVAGDYDSDGDDDLFVTGLNRPVLYRNRGNGTFEDVTSSAGVLTDRWTTAAGFGDLDGDGDLDLVVITYVTISQDAAIECRDYAGHRIHCTPGRYPAQSDLLFRNNGNGSFTEISRAAGFEASDGRGLGLAIADFDDDGKLDIFVANDASPNFLFRNLGGMRFQEVGQSAGVSVNGSGRATASMGVVADDLDGDGRIDLFITNLVNESSTFFRNAGGGLFVDATLGAGLDAPSRSKTGFGAAALDGDADGRLDLFVVNGHVDDRPWANSPMAQTALFFWGRGHGRFDLAGRSNDSYTSRVVVGRGVAAGDLNNDGRVDLVVVHRDSPTALLFNQARTGHWLGVRLRGSRSSRTPVGAEVTCRANGRSITRWQTSGTGYLSGHDPRIWLGLGVATRVETLEIKWLSGLVQTLRDLAPDRVLEIEEGNANFREAGKP